MNEKQTAAVNALSLKLGLAVRVEGGHAIVVSPTGVPLLKIDLRERGFGGWTDTIGDVLWGINHPEETSESKQ